MVPNTRELLPEPEMPVNTVSRRFGSSTLMSLRLFTRAPWTRIRSWLSAACVARGSCFASVVGLIGSAQGGAAPRSSTQLLDPDQVARGVAYGAVAHAVGLLGRLLD